MGDVSTVLVDTPLRLRTNILDALMREKGVRTVVEQARVFGLNRTHWFGIRSGDHIPNLDTALRVAQAAGTTVEALFGRDA